jgi:circadian clock protein KaiC
MALISASPRRTRKNGQLDPRRNGRVARPKTLEKSPSGIEGLDEVTGGGLPRGRPTLVCGGAGCGKSLFAMEFLVRGALDHGEHGVFVSFEEGIEDMTQNVASLGFDLPELVRKKQIALDYVRIERNEIEESGEYDLEGLFIRLQHAIDSVGAKRVVLDTIESLFSGLSNLAVLRAELRRLFKWLKDQRVTAIITAERGEGTLTRHGLEEYVSDCVILLDHRVTEQLATRRLRIVKYRGSTHGTNEYPFLIDADGISVLPLSSLDLEHAVSRERMSSGIPDLDDMLEGQGYYRGSSILVSGTAGTGKTTMAASFVAAACARGERCLLFAFEESPDQIQRNMAAVGIDLGRWVKSGRLRILSTRPTYFGLEMHLAAVHKALRDYRPTVVAFDPISNLIASGTLLDVQSMLLRVIDHMKGASITALFTSLTHTEANHSEDSELGVSSLMDTWLLLRDIELAGERNRGLYVLKSRGMNHSNQIREFPDHREGDQAARAYLGPSGVLTGSARLAEEVRTAADESERQGEIQRLEVEFDRKRRHLQAQISALQTDLETEEQLVQRLKEREGRRQERTRLASDGMLRSRRARQVIEPRAKPRTRRIP